MRHLGFLLLCMSVVFPSTSRPLAGQACEREGPLALVLSGGGAKGLAHIGVIRVLDSLGIVPDLVVGTSMGSIVGGMYASGYTASEIEQQARALGLARLFTSSDPRMPRSLSDRRPLIVWAPGGGGFRTGVAGARESGVNASLNRVLLRGNLSARGNFDSLPTPFRAIATDLRTREEVVLASGDLSRAIRASMAVPLVFDPVRIDGRDLIDGGIAANVPVAAARAAGATRVIVSDVSWRPPDSVQASDPLVIADLLVAYLFTQGLDSLGADDRLIRPAIDTFATLDFAAEKIPAIIARGQEAAESSLASQPPCVATSARVAPRPGRQVYRVGGIQVTEGGERERDILERQLGVQEGDFLDVPGLRERFLRVSERTDYQEVWMLPSGPPDSLTLSFSVKPSPRRLIVAGLAYDNDIGGLMWLGGIERGTLLPRVENSVTLVLGELRQEFSLGLRPLTHGQHALRTVLWGRLAREEVRQFTPKGGNAPNVQTGEAMGFLGFEHSFGRRWLASAGGFGHLWDAPGSTRDDGLGGMARLSSGPRYSASGIWTEGVLTNAYRRVQVEARQVVAVGWQVRVTPSLRFGWGEDLPLQQTFSLGGYDGFPGLNIGERRGDRELLAQVLVTRKVLGPLSVRVTAVSGQTAFGGQTLPRGRWQAGGRLGVGAETALGPIRVEYGVERTGRNSVLIRVGEWF
jgi:NTE family protein